ARCRDRCAHHLHCHYLPSTLPHLHFCCGRPSIATHLGGAEIRPDWNGRRVGVSVVHHPLKPYEYALLSCSGVKGRERDILHHYNSTQGKEQPIDSERR